MERSAWGDINRRRVGYRFFELRLHDVGFDSVICHNATPVTLCLKLSG
jgi:hypothetical protein